MGFVSFNRNRYSMAGEVTIFIRHYTLYEVAPPNLSKSQYCDDEVKRTDYLHRNMLEITSFKIQLSHTHPDYSESLCRKLARISRVCPLTEMSFAD